MALALALIQSWRLIFVVLLVLAIWASQAAARPAPDASMAELYNKWMLQHGRMHTDDVERSLRFKIFMANVRYIQSFNEAGTKPYTLAINKFADLTNDEFRQFRTGFKTGSQSRTSTISSFRYRNFTEIPPTMDWRIKGAVTSVKDQGGCGK